MNATTSLDRDQILDPCELIHPRSGNPSGSRVSCPGIVPPHPGHFVDAREQSHSGVADRHSRGFPKPTGSRVVTVYTSLIAEAIQGVGPDVGDLDPDPAACSSTVPWRPADHGPSVLSCDWGKRHTTGMNPAAARLSQFQRKNTRRQIGRASCRERV